MATVTGSDRVSLTANQQNSAGLITPTTASASINFTPSYANGTGANQIDLMYAAQFTASSAAHAVNLTSLTDLFGGTVNMLRVREMIVQVVDTTAGHLVNLYASSASGWSFLPPVADQLTVSPGGVFHLSDPLAVGSANGLVTGSASKLLLIDPGSNAVTVNLMILGCSAVS